MFYKETRLSVIGGNQLNKSNLVTPWGNQRLFSWNHDQIDFHYMHKLSAPSDKSFMNRIGAYCLKYNCINLVKILLKINHHEFWKWPWVNYATNNNYQNMYNTRGLAQDCSALAMELPQSCTMPSITWWYVASSIEYQIMYITHH